MPDLFYFTASVDGDFRGIYGNFRGVDGDFRGVEENLARRIAIDTSNISSDAKQIAIDTSNKENQTASHFKGDGEIS